MNRVPVESSMMATIGYDHATAILEVEFHNGSVYAYVEVPPELYAELTETESKGQFFNTHVRAAFRFQRVL